jgi:hypothetical protein
MAVYCKDGIPVQFVWPALGQPPRGVSLLKLAKKIKRTYASIQLRGLMLDSSASAGELVKILRSQRRRTSLDARKGSTGKRHNLGRVYRVLLTCGIAVSIVFGSGLMRLN